MSAEIVGSNIWWFPQDFAHSYSLHQWPEEVLWEGWILTFLRDDIYEIS
jgi:hypothetical protein